MVPQLANVTAELIVQNVIDAISVGSLYALFALGIASIFGIMSLVNFAHGELILAGGLTLVLLDTLPIAVSALVVACLTVALALAMDRIAFRPVRGANPATMLITSFAVSFTLQNFVIVVFGARPRTANISGTLTEVFVLGDVIVPKLNVLTVVLTLTLLVGTNLFLTRTRIGREMRAAAEDFRMARILGVKANRVIATAFGLSGLLAAAAAVLLVAQTGTVTPTMGVTPVIFGFIAAVVGGLGLVERRGAWGIRVGRAHGHAQATLPAELRPYRDAFVFIAIFILLVIRPGGLIMVQSRQGRV